MGKKDFVTVQISNENTLVQIHKPEMKGDKILASAHSRFLLSKGWKGSRKNIPAAYLTGYLAGKKALTKGYKSAILYSGTRRYTDRMAAALKGILDAGIDIPTKESTTSDDNNSFPSQDRINGEHLKVKNDVSQIKSQIDSEVN
jgi:large subunit ribosomal protein L18